MHTCPAKSDLRGVDAGSAVTTESGQRLEVASCFQEINFEVKGLNYVHAVICLAPPLPGSPTFSGAQVYWRHFVCAFLAWRRLRVLHQPLDDSQAAEPARYVQRSGAFGRDVSDRARRILQQVLHAFHVTHGSRVVDCSCVVDGDGVWRYTAFAYQPF